MAEEKKPTLADAAEAASKRIDGLLAEGEGGESLAEPEAPEGEEPVSEEPEAEPQPEPAPEGDANEPEWFYEYQGQKVPRAQLDQIVEYAAGVRRWIEENRDAIQKVIEARQQGAQGEEKPKPESEPADPIQKELQELKTWRQQQEEREKQWHREQAARRVLGEVQSAIEADDVLKEVPDGFMKEYVTEHMMRARLDNKTLTWEQAAKKVSKDLRGYLEGQKRQYVRRKAEAAASAPPGGGAAPGPQGDEKFTFQDVIGRGPNSAAAERRMMERLNTRFQEAG